MKNLCVMGRLSIHGMNLMRLKKHFMIQSKLLLKYPDIEHFFLNGSESQSNAFRPKIKKAYSCGQIHQNRIVVVKRKKHYSEFDGLVSQKKSELVIRTADCLPIFL